MADPLVGVFSSADVVAIAALGVTALVACVSAWQTARRAAQDRAEAAARREHELAMARLERTQRRVETLYLEVRAYTAGRIAFVASSAVEIARLGAASTIVDPDHEPAAAPIRDRVALYGSPGVLARFQVFHEALPVCYGRLSRLRETVVLLARAPDSDAAAALVREKDLEVDASLEALHRAASDLEAAMRAELAA